MCGIAVSLDLSGASAAEPWALPLMRHRGPDGSGCARLGPGQPTLEHCRLAIIDPGNREADQPFSDTSGRWTLAYNGELFNYRELRGELEGRGVRFRTRSDTEVVLQSLIADGEAALRRFRGMFAFVLWDAENRVLLAARDQIGIKPLYYTVGRESFIAASELRTLSRHPSCRPRLDPCRTLEYLSFGTVSGDGTLLEDVRTLPPGHLLRLARGRVAVEEYWDALPAATCDGDAQEELLRRLDRAVASALVSDVPVSLMLSAGLDSSAIAALAAAHRNGQPLTAYSVSFGLPGDETGAARRLAGDLGLRHHELRLTEETLRDGFDDWLGSLDVPTANPTWLAVAAIARAVREDGTKVLLSGDGGDELFGGYNRWMTYLGFHDRVWRRLPRPLRRAAGLAARPFARGLAGDVARRAREDGQLFVGSRPFHDDDLGRCLGPSGRAAFLAEPPETPVERLRERFEERLPGGDQLAWMSYLALKTDLVEDYLVRLDTMGMRSSVEGRVPLLDVDLVELAFALPQDAKVGPDREQKALFRRAVSRVLPAYVTSRPKQGFSPPVGDWASTLLAKRLRRDGILVELGLIAPRAVDELRRRQTTNAAFALWTLGTLEVWCEHTL